MRENNALTAHEQGKEQKDKSEIQNMKQGCREGLTLTMYYKQNFKSAFQ